MDQGAADMTATGDPGFKYSVSNLYDYSL